MTDKTIYDLGLHESMHVNKHETVEHVPGGWIYYFYHPESGVIATLIPYNDEFKPGNLGSNE